MALKIWQFSFNFFWLLCVCEQQHFTLNHVKKNAFPVHYTVLWTLLAHLTNTVRILLTMIFLVTIDRIWNFHAIASQSIQYYKSYTDCICIQSHIHPLRYQVLYMHIYKSINKRPLLIYIYLLTPIYTLIYSVVNRCSHTTKWEKLFPK